MKKFGVGVLGATGFIGTPYRSEIRQSGEDAQLVALCARRRDRLEKAGQEDGATLITDQWKEVIDHPEVDLVLVLTPDALHLKPALACAAAGKHIVCEKPLGKNVGEAYDIWSAFRLTQLAHFIPFWTRYVPVFARAREIVQSGRLGEIKAVMYRWHNPRPAAMPYTWRDDAELSAGGSIADVGSHAYDLVRWTLNGSHSNSKTGEARRVLAHAGVITPAKADLGPIDLGEAIAWGEGRSATGVSESQQRRQATAPDYAGVLWEFENNVVGSFTLSHSPMLRKGLAPEVEFHGTDAALGVDRLNSRLTLADSNNQVQELETVNDPGFGNRFAKHVFPALRRQIENQSSDHPDLYDGWRAQIFTDAVALSAQRGAWVELAEFDAPT